MIDSLTLPLSHFDLEAFIKAYRRFYRKWSGDDSLAYFIVGIGKHDDIPMNFLDDDDEDQEAAIHQALVSGETKVFFMLHEPTADDRFLCIDGKRRKSDDLDLALEDGYGYLIEVEGDKISLHPALYDGSNDPPSITIQGTCSVMEGPMKEFVQRFVRG